MTLPLLIAHQHAGQGRSCLAGLVRYAGRIAQTPEAARFGSDQEIIDWLWQQPVKLDLGEDGVDRECGCDPCQRSRIWPRDGLNCWEALAHYVGVGLRQHWPVEIHLYDARIRQQRHVWPAVRPFGESSPAQPVILQRPAPGVAPSAVATAQSFLQVLPGAAQAWYNDLFGVVHFVGDKVLRVFGVGGLSDTIADAADDSLPDWARTSDQKKQREAEREAERKQQKQQPSGERTPSPAYPVALPVPSSTPAAPPTSQTPGTQIVRVSPTQTLITV